MLKILKEENLHKIFDVAVVSKGVTGLLEVLGAFLLLIVSPEQLNNFVAGITQYELSRDPDDYIATHLARVFEHYSGSTQFFGAAYLLIHGLIKIFLVWGLLKNKLWAYPSALAFLAAFMGYQIYRYTFTQSWSLMALTIFDAFIFILTWHEYNFVREHRQHNS